VAYKLSYSLFRYAVTLYNYLVVTDIWRTIQCSSSREMSEFMKF